MPGIRVSRSLLLLVTFFLATGSGLAQLPPQQCPLVNPYDDGFNNPGSCCGVVAAGIPNIPPVSGNPAIPFVTIPGRYACFSQCLPESEYDVDIAISLTDLGCGDYIGQVMITPSVPGSGAPTMTAVGGFIVLKYSRTFTEYVSQNRIWRFLANGHFDYTDPEDLSPCPVPPCHASAGGPFADVFFSGFIDVICGPTPGNYTYAVSLNHLPGCVTHIQIVGNPAFNGRGIAASQTVPRHDRRSYHIVGPRPFVFAATPLPTPSDIDLNSSTSEAVRSTVAPFGQGGYSCRYEASVLTTLTTSSVQCACFLPGLPVVFDQQIPAGISAVTCGANQSFFSTVPTPNYAPTGFSQYYVGRWGAVPGYQDAHLFANVGVINYADVCNPAFPGAPALNHVTYGATTFFKPFASSQYLLPSGPVKLLTDFVNSFATQAQGGTPGFSPGPPGGFGSIVWQLSK